MRRPRHCPGRAGRRRQSAPTPPAWTRSERLGCRSTTVDPNSSRMRRTQPVRRCRRRDDGDAATPPLAEQRLDHALRRLPMVVGPVAEAGVEVVDGDHEGSVGSPHRGDRGAQSVPLRARRSIDADDRATAAAAAARATAATAELRPLPGPPTHEQVTVGTGIPYRELVALVLGLVDEAEHERARRDGR